MKRFYKETAVDAGDGGFRVLLDGRPMRTPAKSVLVAPTKGLAQAIAEEWRVMPEKVEINPAHLPLTRLAATGLDRVASQRARVIEDTAKYGASDLLCYRATVPASLVQRQAAAWQPLLDWAAERFGASLAVASGTTFVSQPHGALAALRGAVAAHGDLALSALYNLTHISGSLVIGLAVSEGRLSGTEAFMAGQLDELFQIERWGADPLATQRHEGIQRDLDACARFLALLGDGRLKG
jgi:chaperone required for assembly of F1-ATPase